MNAVGWLPVGVLAGSACGAFIGLPRERGDDAAFGLPPRPTPLVATTAQIELGRQLFFDRRLSFNGTMSCAMCHVPEQGLTSHASKTAVGIEGRSLRRNAPSLWNVAWQGTLFHDGRERSLVAQAWLPLLHADEMANPSVGAVLDRLHALPDYAGSFERAFGGLSMDSVGRALAAFQGTLVAANSRFDRWFYGGEKDALTALEQRGFALFTGRARCAACHTVGERGALFADGRFHVTGAGAGPGPQRFVVPLAPGVETVIDEADLAAFAQPNAPDLGRFEITLEPAERHAFRTSSLRNVSRTAPYMHDGSLATLADVIAFYERGGGTLGGRSALLAPLNLDEADRAALLAFLATLAGADLDARAASMRPGARR